MGSFDTDPASLIAASDAQKFELFADAANLATYGLPDKVRWRTELVADTYWGIDVHSRHIRPAVPEAVAALGMAGSFMANARGDVITRGSDCCYRPHSCSLFVDLPMPEGYSKTGFYSRTYGFYVEDGELDAYSRIAEDYVPANETAESWLEARKLERLTGVITVAEYRALKTVMQATRLYLARRAYRTLRRRPKPSRPRLVLPHVDVA